MDFFTVYIYQPFLNILIGLYWVVGKLTGKPDMGIAVILFAVAVRIILLPIDLIGEQSDEEKFKIAQKIKEIKKQYSDDPVREREETRRVMRQSPGAIASEVFNITVQVLIILILYRIFTTGLEGADLHLIYPFMPPVHEPINLMFLGKYDLSRTNSTLNLIQSIMIALSEIFHLYFAPVKPTRKDFISLVLILPTVSFLVFMLLPAGKKVFIITSLAFGIIVMLIKQILYFSYSWSRKPENTPPSTPPSQPQNVPNQSVTPAPPAA